MRLLRDFWCLLITPAAPNILLNRSEISLLGNTVAAMENGGKFSGIVTSLVRSALREYMVEKSGKGKGSLAVLGYLPAEMRVNVYEAERSAIEGE